MGAEQVELDDDGVVGVMDDVDDVALVGECGARGGVVAADRFLAVVHLAGGDQLVARVREGSQGHVELVAVFRFHVLAHHHLALGSQAHQPTR